LIIVARQPAAARSFDADAGGLSKRVYRWAEHTGELELRIDAPTEEAVFAEALTAFAELVADDGSADAEREEVEIEAHDRETLLAEWLNELVYLADARAFVPERLTELRLEGTRLRATLRGHRGEPRPLVKAVTLHGLSHEGDDELGWHARVVLDV
jgi:SHS2 domain-containing protein